MNSAVGDKQAVQSAKSAVQIEPVTDKKGIMELIEFPFKLYRDDPNWVPPFIEERRDLLDPKKNPFFEHSRIQFFLARRNGELVGTIGAIINDNHNTFHNEKAGGFGFFETIDDPEVAGALLHAAEDWLRKEGMTVVRGPMNPSTWDEWGLLIEGVDEPPVVMMPYNPHYYVKLIEDAGYHKAMDLYAWLGELDERLRNAPPKVFSAGQKATARHGITVRKARMKDFEKEVEIILKLTNEVWSKNWGFVPLTEHEAKHLAANLKMIIDPDLVLIAENREGEPVGYSLTLPDLHQILKKIGGGHMLPFGVLKFLWYRRQPKLMRNIRLAMLGVKEGYRMHGIDGIFYVETARTALAKGYSRMEGSWILEVNTMMNRIIERLGATRYKTYRIYEKAL
jgi:hypothetical protein